MLWESNVVSESAVFKYKCKFSRIIKYEMKKEGEYFFLLNVFEVERFEFTFRINRTGND